MIKEETVSHLKKKYLSHIDGKILFTAPHSKKLQRGGKMYNQNVRIHKRQIYTSFLASSFALETGSNSFCVWGKSSVINEDDIDPNYILEKQFQNNPFHQCLHSWAQKHQGKPLLHIDVHGKMDRKSNRQIDVGFMPMAVHWDGNPLIKSIHDYFKKNNVMFEGYKFGQFICEFNTKPDLHGYWGGQIHTMTEQAILLGIPSIQLEIPRTIRKKLLYDKQLRNKLCKVFMRMYDELIIPFHKENGIKMNISKTIALKFKPTILASQKKQLVSQLETFEKKQEAQLANKSI